MAEAFGFRKYKRVDFDYRDVEERIKDYKDVARTQNDAEQVRQALRCMDCGIPYCHSIGCPLGNLIPEWNTLIGMGLWEEAYKQMEQTCNFPEITGKICPGLCEASCSLAVNDAPVSIKQLEYALVEKAFAQGWVRAHPPTRKTGKKVAVIGSGPAGLTVAQELCRQGHEVVLFEKAAKIGGLLRYGIPDFKLEKYILDRRFAFLEEEGLKIRTNVNIGLDLSIAQIQKDFDATVICTGARTPRDIKVPGRELPGIHFALDYLSQSNKTQSSEEFLEAPITARAKKVLVIGGGDTGSDCIGTAKRQGAKEVFQYEIMPKPLLWEKSYNYDWPEYSKAILRTSSSQEEGVLRDWGISTLEFIGKSRVEKVNFSHLVNNKIDEETKFSHDIDLVLLAMGFLHTEHAAYHKELSIEYDERGNIRTKDYQIGASNIFAAGDSHTGASLVVHAFTHGRKAANAVHRYLMQS